MRKRILPLLCLAIFCLVLLQPLQVPSAAALDPHAQASLTLHYQKNDQAFPGLSIGIYRIAAALPDGTFELIEPYASYPISIHDITAQEQWQHVAQTVNSYIVANQTAPDREEKTDEAGTVFFSGLETGLYFVREAIAEHSEGTHLFNQFMIYLPSPQTDGSFDYDVEANPKCIDFIPKTQYTVTKLWQDAGNQQNRPKEVTVDLYQDGILQETQVLSAANNWSYTWYVSDGDPGRWTVTERSVPEGYKVTVQQKGSSFSLINTCKTKPQPPQTGDTFTPLPWVLTMGFSGVLLLIVAVYGRRRIL